MPVEPTIQPMTPWCDTTSKTVVGCPVCGAALVPVRGQYRCSRCFFALCAGCEPVTAYEPAEARD